MEIWQRHSHRQIRALFKAAVRGRWRDLAFGKGFKEPDWDVELRGPEEENEVHRLIEEQKRLRAEARSQGRL